MKFTVTVILCLLCTFCPVCAGEGKVLDFTAGEKAWIADHPVIRVGFPNGFPPGAFLDDQGQPAGMLVDYIRIVRERTGIHTEIVFFFLAGSDGSSQKQAD